MFEETNTIHQLRKFYWFISKTLFSCLGHFSPCFLHLFHRQCWGIIIIRVVVWMRKLSMWIIFSNFLFFSSPFSSLFSSFISVAMLGDNKSGGVDEKAEYMNKFVRGRWCFHWSEPISYLYLSWYFYICSCNWLFLGISVFDVAIAFVLVFLSVFRICICLGISVFVFVIIFVLVFLHLFL